jgi:hypothetical protein
MEIQVAQAPALGVAVVVEQAALDQVRRLPQGILPEVAE